MYGSAVRQAEHLDREKTGGVPRFHAEFHEDSLEVRSDRVRSDAEDRGNFRIGLSLRDPNQHFGFARRQAEPHFEWLGRPLARCDWRGRTCRGELGETLRVGPSLFEMRTQGIHQLAFLRAKSAPPAQHGRTRHYVAALHVDIQIILDSERSIVVGVDGESVEVASAREVRECERRTAARRS